MILKRKGNILEAFHHEDIQVLAHGCNCSGGFGSGVAGQIAQEWPEVRTEYREHHKKGLTELGNVQMVRVDLKGIVANCFTQLKYGSGAAKGTVYVSYVALRDCMQYLDRIVPKSFKIGMPMIGCGLAGGEWKVVERILNSVFTKREVIVYKL